MNRASDLDPGNAVRELKQQGYTIIEDFLSAGQLAEVKDFLAHRGVAFTGRNNFEGSRTERIYALLTQGKVFQDIVEDARIMALCDQFLEPKLPADYQPGHLHPPG